MDLTAYGTDKIAAGYLPVYERLWAPLRERPIALLELGVLGGESLRLWRDFFAAGGPIVGVDRTRVTVRDATGRIHVAQGEQDDPALLTQLSETHAPGGWDVIIDDASHLAGPTRHAFAHLFERLKPGGYYSIEDWGTGYWCDWPDGERWWRWPKRQAGMVGLVKTLVDEAGARDATRGAMRRPPGRPSRFAAVTIAHGLCVVEKAGRASGKLD